ncbi:hypothetical protein HDU67_008254 [Dinochytrium kinnereticum]|nr:hypothetical protein HDU67_008254 [Dinochytrium kinnereticum]
MSSSSIAMTVSTNPTFEIAGMERCMAMSTGCMRIAHALRVTGPLTPILDHVVPAFRMTFNTHPRMRVRMSKDPATPFTATVGNLLDIEEVEKLVEVNREAEGLDEVEGLEVCRRLVEARCNLPTDRSVDLPFSLMVLVRSDEKTTLILFSDHFMSDGFSGLIVLNDILKHLTTLITSTHEGTTPPPQPKELPLRPSIYNQVRPPSLFTPLVDTMINTFAVPMLKSEVAGHIPILPINSKQKDFKIPVPLNPSEAFMRTGKAENLTSALTRCREEKVTLHVAILAALLIGFERAAGTREKDGKFRMKIDSDFNMRGRVKVPFEEKTVGYNVVASPMEVWAKNGVDFSKKFWDVARSAKQITDSIVNNFTTIAQAIYVHHRSNAKTVKVDVEAKWSIFSDLNVSNLGRYPYPTVHNLPKHLGNIRVEGLHLYNSLPHIAYAAIFFVTSVEQMDFTMMSKFEEEAGRQAFGYICDMIEAIGSVGGDETLRDASTRVLGRL